MSATSFYYRQNDKDQPLADWKLYAEAKERASLRGNGLWSEPAPVAPWDFRRNKRALPVAEEGCGITFAGTRPTGSNQSTASCSMPLLST